MKLSASCQPLYHTDLELHLFSCPWFENVQGLPYFQQNGVIVVSQNLMVSIPLVIFKKYNSTFKEAF